jgi:hypothetical protein
MTCSHCGATLREGARFCDRCGGVVGQPGATPPTTASQAHPLDTNDALAMGGFGASLMGRGAGGDVASYMMSKAALENLEESGRGDSAMADMARAGLQITKIKIIAGVVVGVIALIIFLAVWSHMNSQFQNQQNQFNNNFPGGVTLAPLAHHLLLGARLVLAGG